MARPNRKLIYRIFFGISLLICLFVVCEYLIYYIVQSECDFPKLDSSKQDIAIEYQDQDGAPLRVMLLADTHLLGSRNGHWFDKLRREWQMYRAFQTAMTLHKPDLVFVLGDLTDEGSFCGKEEFDYYVRRFFSLFKVPSSTKLYVTVGNHDIGFHYEISPYLNERFVQGFEAPAVRMITERNVHFVLLNSMALEGDGCFLCRNAENQINQIERILKCSKGVDYGQCDKIDKLNKYSKPILLQHFPLYRQSDKECNEPDSAPFSIKNQRFRERWECLSQESTEFLINQLRPRLAISGHTHHGCELPLPNGEGVEITIPSFSWRNKPNPTYLLLTVTPNNYAVSRCFMPQEPTVINIYIIGSLIFILWTIFCCQSSLRRRKGKWH